MENSRAEGLLRELDKGWRLNTDGHLGHHPDLYIAWSKCKVEIWTHKISGLTESDFYLAAKADRAFKTSN